LAAGRQCQARHHERDAGAGGAPQVDPLGETYYSITPFRYGDFIAKFRLRPLSAALTSLNGQKIDTKYQPRTTRHLQSLIAIPCSSQSLPDT